MTPFKVVYDRFFSYINDDYYMEISREQTKADCKELLLSSIPFFSFPNSPLDYIEEEDIEGRDKSYFIPDLTLEEKNILAVGMQQIWVQRQITSIEHTRQKFSGPDFKLSSQASHLKQLQNILISVKDEHWRLECLYGRRKVNELNKIVSTMDSLAVKHKHYDLG